MSKVTKLFNEKVFLKRLYDFSTKIQWRWDILSLNDAIERIVTTQDYLALKYVFENYKDHIKLIEVLFNDIRDISHYSKDYEIRYKKVINTFNYLRYWNNAWNKEYVPDVIMDWLKDELWIKFEKLDYIKK